MNMRNWGQLLVLCSLLWQAPLLAQPLRPFNSESLNTIVQAHKQQPLLVVFWSADCPPCIAELKMLSRHQPNRRYKLVLVSVDGIEASDDSIATLKELGFNNVENWVFADAGLPARLFYSVDPTWQGELPRSEFFAPGRGRFHHIGKLTVAQIESWLGSNH